jgi:hypothetical protein
MRGGREAWLAKPNLPLGGRFCRVIYAPLTMARDAARILAASWIGTSSSLHQRGLIMRISGPNGTTLASQSSSIRRTSSGGFSLPDTASATETRATLAPKATAGIDALLAMQGIEEDLVERRKRSVQRGKRALDVLDDLKIGLLSGNFDASTVSRLRDAAANLKSSSGDPGLDSVLSEIELRVEVELAKAGQF